MSKGISLRSKDAIESGGLFGPGPATIKEARWSEFEYKKKGQTRGKKAPVLLVTYERDGEESLQPYGIGSGWRIEKDGLTLTPRNGQSGLPNNCNAIYFIESLEEAGMPDDYLETPDQLDGVEVELIAKPIERDFGDEGMKKKSILVVDEVTSAPWMDAGKALKHAVAKAKGKAKDESADEDDDDEKPKSKAKRVEDDDEDEAPTTKGKTKAKSKDADAEELDEEAVEALVALLEAEDKVKIKDIESKLRTSLKKHARRDEIAARATEDDFLDLEKGWSRSGSAVTLDND